MAHLKKQLLEHLIRECVREVLEQTVGAPSPPADGLGTADQPPIPYDKKKIDELKAIIKNLIREAFSK